MFQLLQRALQLGKCRPEPGNPAVIEASQTDAREGNLGIDRAHGRLDRRLGHGGPKGMLESRFSEEEGNGA
jgi:hypothetical protein